MSFDTIPRYARKKQDLNTCGLVPNSTVPAPGLQSVLRDGEEFTRSALIKGDHVHALPYSFTKSVVACPQWEHEYLWRGGSNKCLAAGFKYKASYKGDGRTLSGFGKLPDHAAPLATRQFVDSLSILKAQASLRKSLVNTPLLLAEFTQTIASLRRISTFVLQNVITMQRKDVKKWLNAVKRYKSKPEQLKRIAQDTANRHLEFVFGILPLINEAEGLAEFLTEDKVLVRTGRGRHTSVSKDVSATNIRGASITTTTETRYSVRTGLICDIKVEWVNDAAKLGFNPIATLYDLVPLSFVVGWFSNFDLWLRSLDPIPALKYRTGYSTRRSETTAQKAVGPGSDNQYDSKGVGHGMCSLISQNRVVHASMPELQELYFMDRMSVFAAAAGLSLTIQRLVKNAKQEIAVKEFRYRGPTRRHLPPIRYRKV